MVAPTTAPVPAAGSLPSPAGAPAGGPVDVAIVGGGIVGLATALRLLEQRPDLRLVILERESELAMHQSGHNSGVVHAGLYYAPGSLKARLCREGKRELEAFCDQHGIAVERTGKLVVALDESELPRFEALRERAVENEVPGLEVVGPERMRELEPHAIGIRALWSPTTGIVDFRRVALAYAHEVRAKGGTIETVAPGDGHRATRRWVARPRYAPGRARRRFGHRVRRAVGRPGRGVHRRCGPGGPAHHPVPRRLLHAHAGRSAARARA